MPRLLVVVLCYNRLNDTLACLQSLRASDYQSGQMRVLVVDNASRDGTATAVRLHYPDVTVIETGQNIGYAAGNNVGLRYALAHDYEYVLLLNNDTELAPDAIRLLVESAETRSSIGVAGPTIYYAEQPDLIWSAGGTIDWRRGTSAMRRIGQRSDGTDAAIHPVDFVTGCALLCRCAVLEKVGLLDERFFMYYEETEWCVRVARAGFEIVHIPAAHMWHKIPVSDRVDKPYVAYYMTRNRLLFLRATGNGITTWLHALILQDLRTLLSLSLRPKWRGRRGQGAALLRGWRDFWLGRFGRARVVAW